MLKYLVHRVLSAIPTLFVLITLAFVMVRLAPGGPFDRERPLPPEVEKNIQEVYHLDEPLIQQYGRYVWGLLHGDFGPSFKYTDYTVTELIFIGLPVSLKIGACAILLALMCGIVFGTLAALNQNSWFDYFVMSIAMTGITIPMFVVAPMLSLFFGVMLKILPVSGWGGGSIKYLILPVVSLALPQIAYISRLVRGSMIEVLTTPFILNARAKGLPPHQLIIRHALKPALLPVVSYLGPAFAALVTGSVVIETIFSVPGLGRYFVQGALNRDYTLVLGVVIFYGALIIVCNLVVDLVYGFLDPKMRHQS